MNTAGAGLALTAARSWLASSRASRSSPHSGSLLKTWAANRNSSVGRHSETATRASMTSVHPSVAAARDALRREELLKAQVIEGGPLVRPRQQQAGAGQELLALDRRVDLAVPIGGVLLREIGEQALGLDPADLGGGRLAPRVRPARPRACRKRSPRGA